MAAEPATAPPSRRRWRRLTRLISLLLVTLFLALLVYGLLAKAPNTKINETLARSQVAAAPGFDLPVLQRGAPTSALETRLRPAFTDGRITLAELRGTPVVLNFWASWCVPCREEAPLLERTWRTARGQEVLVVGLNQQDLTEDARAFMREFGISYPNVRDQSNGVARRWGVTGLPETFFITARGGVVGHVIGVISPEQMRAGIAASRSGRSAGLLQGGERRSTP